MHHSRSLTAAALILAGGLAACGDDETGPSTDPNLDSDIAASIGFGLAQDVRVLINPGFATGQVGAGNEFQVSSCVFTATVQRFVCPAETWQGFQLTRSYSFTDASGNVLTAYDPAQVGGVDFESELTGSATLGSWTGTVDWRRDFTVTGISAASTTWTWNGTGTGTITASRHGTGSTARTYNLESTTQLTSVVVPYPLSATGWPRSGTITRNVTITYVGGPRDGEEVNRTVTVTFDGTQNADLTVGSRNFTLNLATGAVVAAT